MDFYNVDKKSKIVVAMSGGVDSSTVAAMLKNAGYENVVGITLFLYDNDETRGISCNDTTFKHDAKTVAEKIGIEHYVLDLRDRFDELVITPFIQSYANGQTPSPCVTCNQKMKFGALVDEAKKLNADILATGHYIKWGIKDGEASIFKNDELVRDQSYFLSKVDKEAINMIRFPIANMTKKEVRAMAEKFDLHNYQKPSSNDICFAGGKDYPKLIEKAISNLRKTGDILDINGNVIGQHKGIFNYTIGQRKGLGVSAPNPLYVVDIDADKYTVTLGEREHLATNSITISNVNWLGKGDFNTLNEFSISAKVRASQIPVEVKVKPLGEGKAQVNFCESVFGVARGQVCAFYDENRLMGGGDI